MKTQFAQAMRDVQALAARPDDATLLELYGLFKQATEGDVNTTRPGLLDFRGRAKWDAWQSRQGLTRTQAMQKYVALVNRLRKA
jgi:acyl-CoA-binding protein